MPKNPIVKYADGQYQFKVPFVIYADFESILVPVSGAPNNPEMSSTRGINVHQPSGWCMYSKFAYGKVTNPLKQYRGRDCVMHQSIPSTNIPPRADPRGNFLKWSKTLPRGKIFLQKHDPRDKKIPTPGEYCERSSQLFLLVGVEILEFCRNQTLKRTGRLFKSYPLVSV